MKTQRKTSVDENYTEIANGLKSYGYGVKDLASSGNGVSDLLVSDGKSKLTVAVEIKTLGTG